MKNSNHLRDASIYIRHWVERQSVNEESLTDWLLYDLSLKMPNLYYKEFTRFEEARKTGADWEWWFVFRKHSIKLRIQAKKLKANFNNYPSLAYSNNYGLQIEKLINDSDSKNFIPLYAFYVSQVKKTACGNHITDEGVYLSDAIRLYRIFIQANGTSAAADDLLNLSTPLSCLFSCPYGFRRNGDLT